MPHTPPMSESPAMNQSFRHLLASGRIGRLELRNRIFMSPMGSNLAEEDATCGERILRYYEARAQGGAAMVIMGSVGVAWPRGSGNQRQVALSEDRFIKPLARVADAVHAHGARIAVQLQHAGAIAVNEPFHGLPFLVPSVPEQKSIDWPVDLTADEKRDMFDKYFAPSVKIGYQEATEGDIEWLLASFAAAAVRAREAGIDGVEIHGGHGYIFSSFLSPSSNRRTDRYGGSLENRARLLTEAVKRIRATVGPDYPVWCRLDSEEYLKTDGISLDDAIQTVKLVEQAGVDAVHVTAYADASKGIGFTEAHTVAEPCKYVPNTAAIKAAARVPVIGVGRIEPAIADRLVAEGKLDFVAMARKLLADPELPAKLAAGRPELIRPCIYCYTCISQIFLGTHTRCAVNAQTGFEASDPIVPATARKRVLVIGGGPAGMEAARVAALRGHTVELLEAGDRLGGTVFFSSIVSPDNGPLIDYLAAQLKELGVKVRLGTQANVDLVRAAGPDVVVVATGAQRGLVNVPGADLPHVLSGDEMREMVTGRYGPVLARKLRPAVRFALAAGRLSGALGDAGTIRWLSHHWLPLGSHVAIYGGGLVGVELAEFLAERGRTVTLIEPGPHFGKELMLVRRWRLMDTLRKLKVRLLASTELVEIQPGRVRYRTASGQEQTRRADHVVMALGAMPDRGLADALQDVCTQVHCIGDADDVGYIEGAIRSGNRVGRTI
jgi:2,4-dienoyl-CoA reductase (NADPH2)